MYRRFLFITFLFFLPEVDTEFTTKPLAITSDVNMVISNKKTNVVASQISDVKREEIRKEKKENKAILWLERAEQILEPEARIKAYKKALELNPHIPQAYLGIAQALYLKYPGDPFLINDKEKAIIIELLKEAVENLNRAIALDKNYAEAYALRADILYSLKKLKELEEKEDGYNTKILKDIDRALLLNASNKRELYYLRSSVYFGELNKAILEQHRRGEFNLQVLEELFNKAVAEIDNGGTLCREDDLECLISFYERKGNAYLNFGNYLIIRGDSAKREEFSVKGKELKTLSQKLFDKARKLVEIKELRYQEEKTKQKEKEKAEKRYLEQTEFGKIDYELNKGWIERATGISLKDYEKNEAEQEKIQKRIKAKIKQKISSGKASAEEYILMSGFSENSQARKKYFEKGISLMEKRNPQGLGALLFVKWLYQYAQMQFWQKENDHIYYLNKARTIINKNIPEVKKALTKELREAILLFSEGERDITRLGKLDRQQAEAFYWLFFAREISYLIAEIYEKLDLPQKAREEYLYLCDTFKDNKACKNAERLE